MNPDIRCSDFYDVFLTEDELMTENSGTGAF